MQIIDEVFTDYQAQGKLTPAWRWELADASVYPRRSLCMQYHESDLAFVQRLLGEEGLFSWFEHSAAQGDSLGAHTLVIADHNGCFQPNRQPQVRYTQSAAASFKEDSLILRVRWDDVFWHIRRNKNKQFGSYNWFVAGHVMAKDRKTVLETFAFGHVGGSPEEVYPQWECVRRFMEEGANAVPAPEVYLPIRGRREGFWWGAQTLLFNTPTAMVASVLLLPFTVLGVFARWLCMLTNRVPAWPADIDAECEVSGVKDRPAKAQATPEYFKIAAFLIVGLSVDAALLGWIFGVPLFIQ